MRKLLSNLARGAPLPSQVTVPTNLDRTFNECWDLTNNPPYHEWGATIKRSWIWLTIGQVIEGTAISLDFAPLVYDKEVIGVFHTHPPYADGMQGVAFSGRDFGFFMRHTHLRVLIVQNGSFRFALAKRVASKLENTNASELEPYMNQLVRLNLRETGVSFQEPVVLANLLLCQSLGLAFFRGEK